MATINYNTAAATGTSTVKAHTVKVRQAWADSWTTRTDIACVQAVWNAAPNPSTATLVRDYGRSIVPGESSFTDRTPVDLAGYWVLIEFANDESGVNSWLGFIDSISESPDGISDGSIPASGRQSFACFGMDRVLMVSPILDSVWRDPAADPAAVIRGGSAIDFNKDGKPNRTASQIAGSHAFESDPDVAEYWSSQDILEYLLNYHLPDSDSGSSGDLDWDTDSAGVPNWDRPTIRAEGQTVHGVITQLLDSRKLLGWAVGYDSGSIVIVPHSIAASSVTLASTTFAANGTQHTVTATADPLTQVDISRDRTDQYDQVVVRGAKRISVARLKVGDGSTQDLEKGWSSTRETAYETAASGETGYGNLSVDEQRDANERVRRKDLNLDVFSRLVLRDDWDFKVEDASDPVVRVNVFDPVSGSDPYKPFPGSIRFLETLPFDPFTDYSGGVTGKTADLNSTSVLPFITLENPHDSDIRRNIEDIGKAYDLGDFAGNVTAEMDGDALSLVVDEGPQYILAPSAEMTLLAADQGFIQTYDYNTTFATVAIEEDRYAESTWPASVSGTPDVVRKKVYHVGDAYQMIYIVPGTPVSLDWQGAEEVSTGGYLRDDSEALKDLARLFYAYHSNPRKSVTIRSHRITGQINVGDMLATVNSESIGSVVTRLQIDCPLGDGRRQPDPTQTIVATSVPMDLLATLQFASSR